MVMNIMIVLSLRLIQQFSLMTRYKKPIAKKYIVKVLD